MTEWDFIKKRINEIENFSLAWDGSTPNWSSQDLLVLIDNLERGYKDLSERGENINGEQVC